MKKVPQLNLDCVISPAPWQEVPVTKRKKKRSTRLDSRSHSSHMQKEPAHLPKHATLCSYFSCIEL